MSSMSISAMPVRTYLQARQESIARNHGASVDPDNLDIVDIPC
jgi:hypothetical protein